MGKERDDKDAAQDIAKDLAEIASHIAQLKADARAYLSGPNYNTLKLRLENAHSAVEAAAVEARLRVRLNFTVSSIVCALRRARRTPRRSARWCHCKGRRPCRSLRRCRPRPCSCPRRRGRCPSGIQDSHTSRAVKRRSCRSSRAHHPKL